MIINASFWVAASFFIFIGFLIYLKIPNKINISLNNKIDEIKKELDESKKLKEEAKKLLSHYENKMFYSFDNSLAMEFLRELGFRLSKVNLFKLSII